MTEEVEIQEDELVEDEIVEIEEAEDESESEDDGNDDSYRGKLNATNRFLQAQGYKFEGGKWVKPETVVATKKAPVSKAKEVELTPKDTLAFIGAGVTDEEDIEEVLKLSRGFQLTVSEALKDPTVKHRLNVLKEQRKIAEATNTRTARGGARTIDSKQLVDNLSRGEVPKGGSTEAEELFWARRGGRRK
jgi:hypothetical protein